MLYRAVVRIGWGKLCESHSKPPTKYRYCIWWAIERKDWGWSFLTLKSPFWFVLGRCRSLLTPLSMITKELPEFLWKTTLSVEAAWTVHPSVGGSILCDLSKLPLPSSLSRGSLVLSCAWGLTWSRCGNWAKTLSPAWPGYVSWKLILYGTSLLQSIPRPSSPLWPPPALCLCLPPSQGRLRVFLFFFLYLANCRAFPDTSFFPPAHWQPHAISWYFQSRSSISRLIGQVSFSL